MFHLMKWFLGLTLVLASALSSQAADPVHPGLKPQLNKTPEAMRTEPTPQVPGVKTAPGLTASVPAKQGITAAQTNLTNLNELKLGKRKDFSRVSLVGLDLSNLNLEQVIFEGADLSGADMTGADLRGVDFTGANLTGANLTKANCERVSFRNARLNKATLKQTLLSGANFTGATLDRAIFEHVSVSAGSIPIKISNAEGAVFNNSYFESHDFKNINMKNVTINGGAFHRTDFTGSNLDGLIILNNPGFFSAKVPVKYINEFKGKAEFFEYIKWVN
jgi:uncharacterized protein YjbI with pentapeptide repeats